MIVLTGFRATDENFKDRTKEPKNVIFACQGETGSVKSFFELCVREPPSVQP